MRTAITRKVSPDIARCELTHREREAIDLQLASRQHLEYEECLRDLGCKVLSLEPEPDLPDSVFVEDTAVVLPEVAVITRPGAKSRRPETESIAEVLASYRPLVHVEPPGTLDGGDVLVAGRNVYVGLSGRTNEAGIRQFGAVLEPLGYSVHAVPIDACLHLKSAVGLVAPNTLLANVNRVDVEHFSGMEIIEVDPGETDGAGALLVGGMVVYPRRFERTRERLLDAGIALSLVDMSELAKAEGGVTCCSLIFDE